MAEPPRTDPIPESHQEEDAGAVFVLQSKGEWWDAGYHLTTAIVSPLILTLPFAFRGLGWGLGLFCLTPMAVITFYSCYLMSKVLDHFEKVGHRHLRFRELVTDVLGSGWMFYFVIFIQMAINTGIGVGSILFAALLLEYISYDYMGFNSAMPSIQATLAPPATGKMVKALLMCYTVIFITFYSVAVSGYWVYGNKSSSNILISLMPTDGYSLAPTWVLELAIFFLLLQIFAIGLVYSQVVYEIMEKKAGDVKQGMFSRRNLIPRLILRTLYMVFCGILAAMLPFIGDISSVVGAIGFIPLDFILPMLMYNMICKPQRSSLTYWINISIVIVFTCAGIMGSFSSIRKLIHDANKFNLFSDDVVG
ncbi:probable GABA transporter 2 [Corylus avellana]|uniref:probable GABA transporter 2 n=1 Tax=Corylus avellana TaxID=13451 RepID=UPI00286C74ED|nr:probable GABA transporter 2 [Corylus avellana]